MNESRNMGTWACIGMTLITTHSAMAQGTLVYDQQSATNTIINGGAVPFQAVQPAGQSFTPAAAFVGFVQFQFVDLEQNGIGTTLLVNLRESSITGNLLAESVPITLPDRYFGTTSFFFDSQIPVTPGTTYFFQPFIKSGDLTLSVIGDYYNYGGGTSFFQGAASPDDSDFWFREGYVVPEPSTLSLVVIGAGFLFWRLGRRT